MISAPNAKSSSWLQALIKTGVFSGASIGTCVGTWIILEHCNLKKYLPYNLQYKDTLEMMSVFVGLISGILSVVFYCRWLKPFTNLQSLKNFLDNYNPNLEKLGVNNNKRYIPEELHETFDALYEGYQKEDGDVFLKKEGFEVLRVVMEKIIYQINPKKYELPTQFYTTSYPVVINNQSGNSPIATGVGNAIGSNLGNYLSRKLFK